MSKKIVFGSSAFDDFNYGATSDKKLYKKIITLLKDIDRTPFSGLGKSEALKRELK